VSDWIELTRPIDASLPLYAAPGYSDPPFKARKWCGIASTGFDVWQLSLGTQTGTHIDAPSHFLEGGATLDSLLPDDCIGRYFHISHETLTNGTPAEGYSGERLLFLDAHPEAVISDARLDTLLVLPPRVWIMAGSLTVASPEPFRFNRALAEAGKFLVEDLAPDHLPRVRPGGEAITLPLRLAGLSGSPARVLVRNPARQEPIPHA
jgi:arylformamidase